MFGAVSPETLDWNFNLTGSLGVSQTPVSASLSPSGGMKGSYKLYQMMRIQGSLRTARSHPFADPDYELEDGEVVWTMEENPLQRSGLPREMTFVMLITKGDVENVVFDINIEPRIASRIGHFPKWWTNLLKYQPFQKEHMDLDRELGQCFLPTVVGRGFNFANLAGTFNDFVKLPGTAYSTTNPALANQVPASDEKYQLQQRAVTSKAQKASLRPSGGTQQHVPSHPSARSQSVPPQQPAQQSGAMDELMDYHIYLHNPRSINLHATPPPPSNSAPPELPSITSVSNALNATDPVPRPKTTAPDRTRSPSANTKLKRRSMTIGNKGGSMPLPSYAQNAVRDTSSSSHGSLRRSRSRVDLRSSPLMEDSHSDNSQKSNTSAARKENIPPVIPEPVPLITIPSPPRSPEDVLIPMIAPSPPSSSNVLSPPLPTWKDIRSRSHERSLLGVGGATGSARQTLPFELNKPTRPTISRHNSGNSARSSSTRRAPRTRDSPSPLRTRREFTPSPDGDVDDEYVEMSGGPNSETTPEESDTKGLGLRGVTRREREISPYAAMVNGMASEEINEAKGDLKALRARKRYSLPAHHHYSYITHSDADKDWDER